jgi:hypothetical protein
VTLDHSQRRVAPCLVGIPVRARNTFARGSANPVTPGCADAAGRFWPRGSRNEPFLSMVPTIVLALEMPLQLRMSRPIEISDEPSQGDSLRNMPGKTMSCLRAILKFRRYRRDKASRKKPSADTHRRRS